jgi:hypothetical protein
VTKARRSSASATVFQAPLANNPQMKVQQIRVKPIGFRFGGEASEFPSPKLFPVGSAQKNEELA